MFFNSPVKRARLLAVLLLASLAWSSTVEFTHHHGAQTKLGESLSSAAQTAVTSEVAQISSDKTNGNSSNSKTGAECLICQLHQNLSVTVIAHTPGVGAAETRSLKAPLSAVVQLSEFTSTGQGRAPPSIV
jgi:hypothetical protein